MAIFRKKQQQSSVVEEDTSTASAKKSRPSVGKWICGSSASKQALKEDNKITAPPPKASSSYSSSTGSSYEDKRDDRQNSFSRKPSAREEQINAINESYNESMIRSLPPPAADSAFGGPPRFDWIDVEYHAATRVQKIFRGHLVLREMEEAGLTTSYIRNRKRQRKVGATFHTVDDKTPDFGFGCCSMSLAFGNEDASDLIAYREFQRKQYEEKNNSRNDREEFLSQSYLEQKGINSKYQELEESKFREESILLREQSLRSLRSMRNPS
mmetsp:Transcript_4738/g.12152  ORF Transcript_4738/g.12152 Transcript_4738/m.12152 type:complete len:269 (-) Transcript_4738:321-1127(-)